MLMQAFGVKNSVVSAQAFSRNEFRGTVYYGADNYENESELEARTIYYGKPKVRSRKDCMAESRRMLRLGVY